MHKLPSDMFSYAQAENSTVRAESLCFIRKPREIAAAQNGTFKTWESSQYSSHLKKKKKKKKGTKATKQTQ